MLKVQCDVEGCRSEERCVVGFDGAVSMPIGWTRLIQQRSVVVKQQPLVQAGVVQASAMLVPVAAVVCDLHPVLQPGPDLRVHWVDHNGDRVDAEFEAGR